MLVQKARLRRSFSPETAGNVFSKAENSPPDRVLRTAEHFAACLGQETEVKLYRPREGRKEFVGPLLAYDDGNITITVGDTPITFEKKEVALVRLYPRF